MQLTGENSILAFLIEWGGLIVLLALVLAPFYIIRLKRFLLSDGFYFVFFHKFSKCSGSFSTTSNAVMQAAATGGGCEPLRSQVLDLLYAKLISSQ